MTDDLMLCQTSTTSGVPSALPPLVGARALVGAYAVAPEDSLVMAEAAMALTGTSHLPVADGEKLVGLVSLRAVAAEKAANAERLLAERRACVEEVMSPPVAISSGSKLSEAAALLVRHHLSCLPVVEGESFLGILTATDLVKYVMEQLLALHARGRAVRSVSSFMTPPPIVTIRAGDSLATAELLMRHGHVRHLVVLDGERLVGMLALRDLLASARRDHGATVGAAMTRAPLALVEPDADAVSAGRLLLSRRIGALPVLREGRLAGILTKTDFVCRLPELQELS